MDAKYILTGGEDDLVQVWSMEDRKVVAWGEGHNSWVRFLFYDKCFCLLIAAAEDYLIVYFFMGW